MVIGSPDSAFAWHNWEADFAGAAIPLNISIAAAPGLGPPPSRLGRFRTRFTRVACVHQDEHSANSLRFPWTTIHRQAPTSKVSSGLGDQDKLVRSQYPTDSDIMPNHHVVDRADPEKGRHGAPYEYGVKPEADDAPFVHGAATVGRETGRGGDTQRGLKSRHIQFLYVQPLQTYDALVLMIAKGPRGCYWHWLVHRIRVDSCFGGTSPLVHGLSLHDDCRLECHEQSR